MYTYLRLSWIISLFVSSSLYASELNWSHNYKSALLQAQKTNKDIYLFIGADICKFCDRFKDIALADKDIMKKLRKEYILVYLSRNRHLIPKGFETKGVPRHYFIDPQGKVFHETWGDREVAGFYDVLDEAELNKMED